MARKFYIIGAPLGALVGIGAARYYLRKDNNPADHTIFAGQHAQAPSKEPLPTNISTANLSKTPAALDPESWKSFKVVKKEKLTSNTFRLRFQFPDPQQASGLFTASCLLTKASIGEEKQDGTRKPVMRPYTPENLGDEKGYLDLVVKGYPNGIMSKHIVDLEPGDELDFKGPMPKLEYRPNMKKEIGMIAGGSGLTPMLQVIKEIARNPEDKTKVSFIFANQSVDDIILKKELDDIKSKHDNIKVHYMVDKKPWGKWEGGVGFVTADVVKQHLPGPSDDSLILVCGPPPMYKALSGMKKSPKEQGELSGVLKDLGYTEDQVYKF